MITSRLARKAVLTGAIAILVGACGPSQSDIDAILALTGDSTAGADLFTANCVECHGEDGQSGTAGANITDNDDGEVVEVMLTGKGPAMPSFGETLEDQQIADVVAYVSSL